MSLLMGAGYTGSMTFDLGRERKQSAAGGVGGGGLRQPEVH